MTLRNIKTKVNELYSDMIVDHQLIEEVNPPISASVPTQITDWLSKLGLLYGVPFEYLVLTEDMLPQESIKFFYVDNNWITALTDGASSIGRVTAGDKAHDAIFGKCVDSCSKERSASLRSRAFGNKGDEDDVNNKIITGFLLRSEAVSNWPGLEINGYENPPVSDPEIGALPILRMDHISSSILLCLFSGTVNYLRIHNPAESLHFGFDSNNVTKTLRDATTGSITSNKITIDSTFYRGDQTTDPTNVINATQLAQVMAQTLSLSAFTSAEFALQMIAGVDMAELDKGSFQQSTITTSNQL